MLRRGFLVSALSAALAGCGSRPRNVVYRFTLEVETPEGIRTGSNLLDLGISENDGLLKGLSPAALSVWVGGEATVVDLGPRGLLFCLLSHDTDRDGSLDQDAMFGAMFPQPQRPSPHTRKEQLEAERLEISYSRYVDGVKAAKPKAAVPIGRLPRLVRFRNLADPFSVETIDPRNLAAAFGSGVRLLGATVEITEGKATRGIEKILPWVVNLAGSIGKDMKIPFGHPLRQINDGSFRRRWS